MPRPSRKCCSNRNVRIYEFVANTNRKAGLAALDPRYSWIAQRKNDPSGLGLYGRIRTVG